MTDLFTSPLAWKAVIGEAALQATLGILVVLAACALIPRLSGTARSWLWRLAFGRVVLALFWSAPLVLPVLRPVREAVLRVTPPAAEIPTLTPERIPELPLERRSPRNAELVLGACWLAGAAWCLQRGLRQAGHARRLLRQARPVTDPELLDCWDDLLNAFELWRAPELRESDEVDSPVLLQVTRPTVLLPTGLTQEWSVEQIRLMLAHELAHVRRHDLLWGWLPAVTHTLLYFHPLVWIGSREWRLAHDSAADELALRITGAPAAEYARLLVCLAGGRRAAIAGLALMDARDSARTLERRLKLMNSRKSAPSFGGASWLGPVFLLGLAIAIPVRVTAQPPAPAPQQSTSASKPGLIRSGLQQQASDFNALYAQARGQLAASAVASRPSAPKGASETPERRRLRETEQQVRALKAELDQVMRRNRELEEIQRQLDQVVRSLRASRGENPPAMVNRDRELRERKLELRRENIEAAEAARLRAQVELDRAQQALQDAQARAAELRPPVAANPDTPLASASLLNYTVRLLLEDRTLSVLKVVAIEGEWVTIQIASGRPASQDEAAAFSKPTQLVRVRAAREAGRLLVQIDWPAAGLELLKVCLPGDAVRFAPDKDRLARLGPKSPDMIEVSVQSPPNY